MATQVQSGQVSGEYVGAGERFEVRLRIDVDRPGTVNRVSADYIQLTTGESVGSMRVDDVIVTRGPRETTLTGEARFSFRAKCKRVSVTVPHAASGAPSPTRARLRHIPLPGADGAVYDLQFTSERFRCVDLEQACEWGIELLGEYDTGALPSNCPPRRLTPIEAFAEAGIELRSSGPPTIVDTSEAGANGTWSDAELQAAMQAHFTRWGDRPRWAVWMLHAVSHDDPTLSGMMFDQVGRQRQGCAVFYGEVTDSKPERLRHQLHACVHELGHVFNLPHCWQHWLSDPPIAGRPAALSWMNYPQLFPGGAPAFWQEFGYTFDDAELAYLRHAFEYDVIMGGKPFPGKAVRMRAPDWDDDLIHDEGLRLRLGAPDALAQDIPVAVELELTATTPEGREVPPVMGPRPGNVGIAIRRPDGSEFMFEPLIYHCRGHETRTLRPGDAPVCDSAFIHYGRRGYAFDRPGRYELRALFAHPRGRVVVSNVASIRIDPPRSRVDRHVSELIARDPQVGTLLSLMGSDARALERGDERLRRIVARYPEHPVAVAARLAQAANLAHGFKRLAVDGTVAPREPDLHAAASLAADVVDPPPVRHGAARARMRSGVDPSVEGFFRSRIREITVSASSYADA